MKARLTLLLPVFVLSVALALTGCETESASKNSVSISPSSATLENGQSVQFTATGGYEYSWSLETGTYGTLATRTGTTTVYTSAYEPDTSTNSTSTTVTSVVEEVLTVTSTISGLASTNATYEMTATAYIYHR